MKVIIAGGGTGGHLFPAVAVGEEIRRERPDAEVLHVGATNGLEARWFPASGLRYELFPVRGFTGKDPLTRLRALREFVAAIIRARALLRSFRADLVVSAGGYASAPMAVAAIVQRTPLVLMEQNTRPGLANRILCRFARKVCVGFAETAAVLGSAKVEVTGNPLRFTSVPAAHPPAIPLQTLVLGGSSGAHRLNIGVIKALGILGKAVINLRVVHQTGEADEAVVAEEYRGLGCGAEVSPFIDDVGQVLGRADLVIARSGAMTVSEVALAGRPAIFVPYPFHRDRQQEHNAQVLARVGAAVIVHDDEQLGENLANQLRHLIGSPQCLAAMGQRARQVAIPDAAQRIARICFEIAGADQK